MSRSTSSSQVYQGRFGTSEAAGSQVEALSGWTSFSGVMLLLAGSFGMINGLIALLSSGVYVTSEQHVVLYDVTQWGWIHLIVGASVAMVGLIVMSTGATWARVLGVLAVSLQAIVQVAFIEAYPYWTIATLALDLFVIYGLIVNPRSDARSATR